MALALRLGRRGLGRVAPNPAVGCILVNEGRVAGRGWTQPGGRPHAETEAISRAGRQARGATAYVTLEPCAHHGVTGPCAEALVAAGIARAVIAVRDPDPRTNGSGIARLKAAGIAVTEGVGAQAAERDLCGFFSRLRRGRPWVTLKLALSLDGRLATVTGASKWLTGPEARTRAHLLRAQNDAILVGRGTVSADDPALTCRLPGLETASPLRVVLDSRGRLPGSAKVFAENGAGVAYVTAQSGAGIDGDPKIEDSPRGDHQGDHIVRYEIAAGEGGGVDLGQLMARLAGQGVTRLLVEGGGQVAGAFVDADLVDELAIFRAPILLGADGVPAAAFTGRRDVSGAPAFRRISTEPLGADQVECYVRP